MQGSTLASILSAIIVVAIVIGAVSYQIQSNKQELDALNSGISALENRPPITVTQTVVSAITTLIISTSTTTTTTISTSTFSMYPAATNVTVLFTQVSGGYSYSITAGAASFTGSGNGPQSVPVKPIFQGEKIVVSASTQASLGCNIGETVTAQLFVDGNVVAQSTTICTGSPAQITYTA